MRSKVGILVCLILGVGVFILNGYTFAEEVQLEGIIARIPSARILDWRGATPKVDGEDAWQEQALSEGNKVCCIGACKYVGIALNRSGDYVARLSSGCMTIKTIEKESVSSIDQNSGESLFSREVISKAKFKAKFKAKSGGYTAHSMSEESLFSEEELGTGSEFTVETPDATIGVTGTVFGIKVCGFPEVKPEGELPKPTPERGLPEVGPEIGLPEGRPEGGVSGGMLGKHRFTLVGLLEGSVTVTHKVKLGFGPLMIKSEKEQFESQKQQVLKPNKQCIVFRIGEDVGSYVEDLTDKWWSVPPGKWKQVLGEIAKKAKGIHKRIKEKAKEAKEKAEEILRSYYDEKGRHNDDKDDE